MKKILILLATSFFVLTSQSSNLTKVPSSVTAVDLGLPSGTKWANMNVGATSVTDYGTYFAWGEVTGCQRGPKRSCIPSIMDGNPHNWSAGVNPNYIDGNEKTDFGSWTYYKWCKGDYDNMTKYCTQSRFGTVDNKKTLNLKDDAAHVNWGGKWRMPTADEQYELKENCYWVWTRNYNKSKISGFIVYKAKNKDDKGIHIGDGEKPSNDYSVASDIHIFLPCANGCNDSSFGKKDNGGYYWSSSLSMGIDKYADVIYFVSGSLESGGFARYYGFTVRAVCH